jgi:preprotein translocase subunit YajC
MDSICSQVILALGPTQTPPGTQPDPTGELVKMVGMLVLFGIVFYFVLIRPQQKRTKEHQQVLKTVKPGDKIVTSGGVLGVVITVKEKTVTFRSADAKLEITKSAIAEITERSGDTSQS